MILAKVIGTVVSTIKHQDYENRKVLIIQPVTPDLNPAGETFLAVDGVQAGTGDIVIVHDEGMSSRYILDDMNINVIRCTIAGIVDQVDLG